MEKWLTTQAIELLTERGNAHIYGEVANKIGVSAVTLKDLISRKDKRLIKPAVLRIFKKHNPELQDTDLLKEKQAA